jgi:hypothetical protein
MSRFHIPILLSEAAKFANSNKFSWRFKPSSRTSLIGEQPNPWDLLQPQDEMSRHRGAEQTRRYGLSAPTSLLFPG